MSFALPVWMLYQIEIVQLVEKKEIAWNACDVNRSEFAAVTNYTRQKNQSARENNVPNDNNKKLTLKGTCSKCRQPMNLFTRYRSGKLNKQPFKFCQKCHKEEKSKINQDLNTENSEIVNFIENLNSGS